MNFPIKNLMLGMVLSFALFAAADAWAFKASPKRIVFEGGKRSETLIISNDTEKTQTYSLEWRRYLMDEKNGLAPASGDAENEVLWADDMVRFAPRRVTIPAGGSQKIHLLARKPADIKEGEYRTHLRIAVEEGGQNKSLTSVALPVFVRNDKSEAAIAIEDVHAVRKDNILNVVFALAKKGNASAYGDFDFVCVSEGKENTINQVQGVALYSETKRRQFTYDIDLKKKESKCAEMTVLYHSGAGDVRSQAVQVAQKLDGKS